jgi:hypothetical protein
MKTVTMIQTQDGEYHTDERSAKRHADKVYGEALSVMSARLVKIEKYSPMMDFIDANLDEFQKLKALRDDCELETDSQ